MATKKNSNADATATKAGLHEVLNFIKKQHTDMYDGHIWQNPDNAIIMMDNILEGLIKIDPENAEYYKSNYEKYKNEIKVLDSDFQEVINKAERKEVRRDG